MRLLHHAWLTVYCKPEDDVSKVRQAILGFFPFSLEKEKLPIRSTRARIDDTREFDILQVHLVRPKHTSTFLKHLLSLLSAEQKQLVLKQKESRLDAENHFFLRFDKQKLLDEGSYWLTDSGNCFHLRLTIAAYPGTREAGLKVVGSLFSQDLKTGKGAAEP